MLRYLILSLGKVSTVSDPSFIFHFSQIPFSNFLIIKIIINFLIQSTFKLYAMKKFILVILLSVLFTLLFFQKEAGLNYVLFALALSAGLTLENKNRWKNIAWILVNGAFLISTFNVYFQHTSVAILSSILSFVLLAGFAARPAFSPLTGMLNGLFSIFTALGIKLKALQQHLKKNNRNEQKPSWNYYLLMLIPLLIFIIFFQLYRWGSLAFDDFILSLNFTVNMPVLLFSLMGIILLSGFFFPVLITKLWLFEKSIPSRLKKSFLYLSADTSYLNRLHHEKVIGTISLGILNLLLLYLIRINEGLIFNMTEKEVRPDFS